MCVYVHMWVCMCVSVCVVFACVGVCVRECDVMCCLVPAGLSFPLSSRISVITVLNC